MTQKREVEKIHRFIHIVYCMCREREIDLPIMCINQSSNYVKYSNEMSIKR